MTPAFRTIGASLAAAVALAPAWVRAQELPIQGPPGDLQREAKDLIEGLPLLRELPATREPGAPRVLSVETAQARLEEARQKEVRWAKLVKQGVVSQVECERCALQAREALVALERARLARAEQELGAAAPADAPSSSPGAPKEALARAEAALRKFRLELAGINLERHRRLYAAKLVSKAAVSRAEATLTQVQAEAEGQ